MELTPAAPKQQIVRLIKEREIRESIARSVSRGLHVTDNFISRLGLEKELIGHGGCVNCLEWNETGQILASASDDMHIILWDPFRYKKKLVLRTGHNGNIFSVKFMPKSNDGVLVSGAGDGRVQVHDVSLGDTIFACVCHTARVKRVATAASVPFLFWSAGEDGLIMQYDIRAPHSCGTGENKCVLVSLVNQVDRYAEAKCVTVNPRRPELIAVGANDAYIRMYDRRMIKLAPILDAPSAQTAADVELNHHVPVFELPRLRNPEVNVPRKCVQYFVAGHLRTPHREMANPRCRGLAATYLTFSSDGNELLANMGGEQIYLFDINGRKNRTYICNDVRDILASAQTRTKVSSDGESSGGGGGGGVDYTSKNIRILPDCVEDIKLQANKSFEQEKYTLAISLYNKAISYCPTAAVLLANRAAAFMKRAWDGDTYAALRDCQATLLLDPEHVKAHFRLARCLYNLYRVSEALEVLDNFRNKFPEYSSNAAYRALRKDVEDWLEGNASKPDCAFFTRSTSVHEKNWRLNTIDYKMRFCGHCNTTTDIKEANFFGSNGQYIVAGSDDGSFFVWDRKTTNIVRVLRGDDSIVNCIQPHPSTCLLATSGIDHVIRLWSPLPEDGSTNEREILNLDDAASANQLRMNSDPFELMLMNMGYRFPAQPAGADADNEDQPEPPVVQSLNCRPS